MKKKILIVILVILILLFCGINIIYLIFGNHKTRNDDVILNEISKESEFLGLVFSDGLLEYDGKESRFTITITNNSSEDIELGKLNIIFKEKNNKEIGVLVGYVPDVIKSGSTIRPTIESKIDLSEAYYIEYREFEEPERPIDANTSVISENEP